MALVQKSRSIARSSLLTAAIACGVAAIAWSTPARAQEPAACLSPDPAQWPSPSKPYFMVAFDTSGSMLEAVGANNSCGYPNDRLGHGRCALKNSLFAFSGQANFGLASYARTMSGCSAGCYTGCSFANLPNNSVGNCGTVTNNGCGPEPTLQTNSADRHGANILVPMLQDNFWTSPPNASNTTSLVSWVDNNCTSSTELFADGCTPLNGILRDMFRYYSDKWVHPSGAPTYNSPLESLANGERACRSVNVILITDGDETCDLQSHAVDAAADLYAGFTRGGIAWSVKTFVINFAGGTQANTNAIAAAGGTGTSVLANNEAELSEALAAIIASSVKPENCDNADNNCNGCTDEGSKHYCNVQQTCCPWSTVAQRTQCLTNYTNSINAGDPDGNVTLLPCTTVSQQTQPQSWLCFNPLETCDTFDNNCQDGIDEGVTKCGNPPHCPVAETCNGQDDDCDGVVDDGSVCGTCIPSQEICDGCDNDCDGIADDGIAPIPCGLTTPPNCQGQLACNPPQSVPPGTCAPGGGFGQCANAPAGEACDGVDNDCDGFADDNIPQVDCVPANAPPGLDYGPSSQCKMGKSACINGATVCNGWVGPAAEICDGIDNDCDGAIDDNVPGVGNQCGINQPPCTPGLTACIGGALVCQGGNGPNPEVCDGVDNDCDGQADETPLVDAPASAGCWTEPAASCNPVCQHQSLTWCPPPGGICNGVGALTPPCKAGTLACGGAAGWVCQGPKTPAPEACDGLDNDCDGTVDEGPIPQVGQPCGSDVGECTPGLLACNAGILDCVNDVGPTPEICDGLDNDCDGVVDNGIPAGNPCTPPLPPGYTGVHDKAPCQPGVLICDGMGGLVCTGGVGPSPEICDGIDNDCDGSVDETGAPPEGIDGTQNPTPPPDAAIGDPCGIDTGECKQGAYACVNGQFACLGSQGPEPEACDCGDNDCNGVIDNENPMNMPPLCSPGNTCVNAPGIGCQCAEPCSGGEVQCTPGFTCVQVTDPNDPQSSLGFYCVVDNCGDCSLASVQDGDGKVICAPAGTPPDADCNVVPVCTCKGQNCDVPCAGVTCAAPEICTNHGPKAGTCVTNDCYNVPCQGCDSVCNAGSCQDDACVPNPCAAAEICKNTYDDQQFECLSPCGTPCPRGEVCDESTGQCVGDKCGSVTCDGGTCCDPVTGACGNCPCEGVVCPRDLQCDNGDCIEPSQGQGGAGGTGGSSAESTGAGNAGGSTPDGAGGDDRAIWGLSTGGGGCACGAAGANSTAKHGAWAVLAVALGLWRRRRRAPATRRAAHVEVR